MGHPQESKGHPAPLKTESRGDLVTRSAGGCMSESLAGPDEQTFVWPVEIELTSA